MFTGLIEELGRIAAREESEAGSRIVISAEIVTSDISAGDSIAVNGVCLTALDVTARSFAADVSPETLDRATLGSDCNRRNEMLTGTRPTSCQPIFK